MSADDRFSRDLVDRQADIFRLYVGPGRRFSWGALSDATATSQSTLKSYANGVQMPLHVALRLIAVLPPEAGNMLIESCGYRLAPIDADADDWAGVGGRGLDADVRDLRGRAGRAHRSCRTREAAPPWPVADRQGGGHAVNSHLEKRMREIVREELAADAVSRRGEVARALREAATLILRRPQPDAEALSRSAEIAQLGQKWLGASAEGGAQ